MEHSVRPSAYLQLSRHGVFYFRIRVPEALRTALSNRFIRRSLRTRCRRDAAQKAGLMLGQIERLFDCAVMGKMVDFKYPAHVRRAIYTTNTVEAVHRQFRKLTKTKGGFANENGLLKLLYAGMLMASEKWTHPVHNWNLTLSQLSTHLPDRIDQYVDL